MRESRRSSSFTIVPSVMRRSGIIHGCTSLKNLATRRAAGLLSILHKEEVARAYHARHQFDHVIVMGDSPNDMIPFEHTTSYLYAHENRPFRKCASTHEIRDLRALLREL